MRFVIYFMLSIVGIGAHAASNLEVSDCSFDEIYAFTEVSCDLQFTNSGNEKVEVSNFKGVRAEDKIVPDRLILPPHSKTYAKATINAGNDVGRTRHIFFFQSSEVGHEKRTAAVRGFVKTIIDDGRPKIDLGVVDLAKKRSIHVVDLRSSDVPTFRAEQVLSVPKFLDVGLADDGKKITAQIKRDAPWGYWVDFVKLRTSTPIQPEVWVGVQVDIHGEIVPASNPVELGLLRRGTKKEQLIKLTNLMGKDFKIGKLELENLAGTATPLACEPKTIGCEMIKLEISDDQSLGALLGKVWVELPEFSQRMPITVIGLLVAKDAQIEDLDPAKLMEEKNRTRGQTINPENMDLKEALKSAVTQEPMASIPGNGPLLKWSVKNEEPIHGYQIYRAESETGPFVLLNRMTIPIADKSTAGTYQYRDNTAESGEIYWYYIGLVYNDGHKQQLTGPQKVVAK